MIGKGLESPELEARVQAYHAEFEKSMVGESLDQLAKDFQKAGYHINRSGRTFQFKGESIYVPRSVPGRQWQALEEFYHAEVKLGKVNKDFLKSEIAAIEKTLPESVKLPGSNQIAVIDRAHAAEEIAIKEHILKTNANILSEADKTYLRNQIEHIRQWGVEFGY